MFVDQPLQALAAHMLRAKVPLNRAGTTRLAAELDFLRQWLRPPPAPPGAEGLPAGAPAGEGEKRTGASKWLSAEQLVALGGGGGLAAAAPAGWALFDRVLVLMAAAADLDERGKSGGSRQRKLAAASEQLENAKLWLGLWKSGTGSGCGGVCGSVC